MRNLFVILGAFTALCVLWAAVAPSPQALGGLFLIALLALYFLPGLVADMRGHKNKAAIGALNFFLGWTLLGWVAALVWAMTDNVRQAPESAVS